MTGGNVIQFHRRESEPTRVTVSTTGFEQFAAKCNDPVHVFTAVPGRCECGDHFWDGAA